MSTGEAQTQGEGKCERIVITTADGRVFDLGCPSDKLYKARLARYRWQRRHEIRAEERTKEGGQ